MNRPPIIHIGYPKTGTKWLQKNYFPNLSGCYHLARPDVFALLIQPDIFEFSPSLCRQQIEGLAQGRRVVVSEELLLGGLDIHFGLGEFILLMAHRLKSVFGDAEVVITIRDQVEVASSVYGHYVKSGGTYSPHRFFGLGMRHKWFYKNHHLFSLKLFEYDRVIALYRGIFGEDRVRVLFYEDFKADPQRFLGGLSEELGFTISTPIPFDVLENKRLSTLSLRVMRLMNRFTAKNTVFKSYYLHIPTLYYRTLSVAERLDALGCLRHRPYRLPLGVERAIAGHFGESNRRLAAMSGLGRIRELGYPL